MRLSAILIILLLVVGVTACGCTSRTQYVSGDDEPGPTAPTTAAATPTKVTGRDALQIVSHELEYGSYGSIYVVGSAKNIGDERISWGSIDVKFYDHDGNLVGNGADFVQDLDPGETWKFKVTYYDSDGAVDSYKIGVGSTW
ncbi:FxLYD domain-containing protein [Methanoculleus thermophilus]|uniref:DUF4352 domain-containing protein n=1 Tax=Methanoculleus thermophilus TaxID=2200 RepID=A0A1G8YYI4_9EURY|nr:FxLYD domain-containing protein [Methanoculleus thermophilus]SDK07797.1 hypothetical protein SAMN04488571_103269 [Methanoculleus thermophilus]